MQRFNKPFPHVVIDGFLDAGTVRAINDQWPDQWTRENGKYQKKWSTQDLPPAARAVADDMDARLIEDATGIQGLFSDPDLFGAGLHCIPRGGFLKMHVDFNRHPAGWHRRCNVLIYLNEAWRPAWGGELQLGLSAHERKYIQPIGGRCVIFETTETSWHGHPDPMKCPDDVQRRSMALYYYTAAPPPTEPHSTVYVK